MQIEYFKNDANNLGLETLKNEINGFVNDLQEGGLKCIDVQFIYGGASVIAFVKYEGIL
ncbi:hypothetical protein [Streptococcus constellatus]|uniref:hypothetical protein n=1 Tax=Streptococcus constellatus TaxID=76860 RepID=UPI0020016343|nr:hypothetical protein [Streptococcus constellatus]